MAISDPIADMLTKIRNAGMVELPKVTVPHSKLKVKILSILKTEGFILDFEEREIENKKKVLDINLKYSKNSSHVIRKIAKVSTPGRRVYSNFKDMPEVLNGYGVLVVSTSKGVMTSKSAIKKKVGGELICSIQ